MQWCGQFRSRTGDDDAGMADEIRGLPAEKERMVGWSDGGGWWASWLVGRLWRRPCSVWYVRTEEGREVEVERMVMDDIKRRR